MIQVYHAKEPTFVVRDGFVPNVMRDYAHVANVYTSVIKGDDLNVAYQLTNSIDTAWTDNTNEVAFLGSPDHGMEGCRSTSVGDVLVRREATGYVTYLVMPAGFKRMVIP